jgi:hypothetical protein
MVSTTTNGYGAVTSRREYWEVDKTLSDEAKRIRDKAIKASCALYDKTEAEMAKSDPKTRERMLREWESELRSIDTSYKLTGGCIFAIVLWAVFAICSFTIVPGWCVGFEWFGTVLGIGFGIGAIACARSAHKNAKSTQETNVAKADRLRKKIREIS